MGVSIIPLPGRRQAPFVSNSGSFRRISLRHRVDRLENAVSKSGCRRQPSSGPPMRLTYFTPASKAISAMKPASNLSAVSGPWAWHGRPQGVCRPRYRAVKAHDERVARFSPEPAPSSPGGKFSPIGEKPAAPEHHFRRLSPWCPGDVGSDAGRTSRPTRALPP